MNNEEIRNAKSFDELLDIKYGKVGTKYMQRFFKINRKKNYLCNVFRTIHIIL